MFVSWKVHKFVPKLRILKIRLKIVVKNVRIYCSQISQIPKFVCKLRNEKLFVSWKVYKLVRRLRSSQICSQMAKLKISFADFELWEPISKRSLQILSQFAKFTNSLASGNLFANYKVHQFIQKLWNSGIRSQIAV